MTSSVYVIGTGHTYQFGVGIEFGGEICTESQEREFLMMLRATCNSLEINLIAEEMHNDGLSMRGLNESVPSKCARDIGIRHIYADPTIEEQKTLGIREETAVRYFSTQDGKTPSEIEADVLAERRKREPIWCDKISSAGCTCCLFVCGSWHVPSFVSLLNERSFVAHILYENWKS